MNDKGGLTVEKLLEAKQMLEQYNRPVLSLKQTYPVGYGKASPKLEEFIAVVKKVRYRPGWTIHVADGWGWGDHFPVQVVFEARVIDAYNHDRTLPITMFRSISSLEIEQWDEEMMLRWIFNCLMDIECHEAKEFFVVDGVRPYDPHPVAKPLGKSPVAIFYEEF